MNDKQTAGIYIHIPFCKTKCMYCDFYSITEREKDADDFVTALCAEISRFPFVDYSFTFDTLFIGGGTPSLLNSNQLETILTALSNQIPLYYLIEKTIEINPGEAPLEKLTDFHSLGMNRISMGVQSLEPELLKFLTRSHSVKQVFKTFDNIRSAGFENVNCDLIYGIPGQTPDIWKRDMNQIIKLNPEHISAYSLTVEKGTGLFQMVKSKKINMPKNDESAEWFSCTQEHLSHSGFIPYEISNFSKPGKECRHNLHYWNIEPYIGFGPSAHSFDGEKRWNNVRSLDQYMEKINIGFSPISISESLTPIQKMNEKIGFGLRLNDGIDLIKFPEKFREQLINNVKQNKKKWNGYINQNNSRVRLKKDGFAFADAIAVDLMF